MNLREVDAKTKLCPVIRDNCHGSACFLWEWDEPLFDGPDSYVAEPGPTGHCGLIKGGDHV
jgi:hypothetical protein